MPSSQQHIAVPKLHELLAGEENTEGFDEIAAHLERCEQCRNTLDDLSGSDSFDFETREMLEGFYAGDQPADEPPDKQPTAVSLDFLSPPSHPEMLGRLGRYEIERVIGSGGMGVVLKGFDTELNRPVAIKVLAQHLAHSGAARQRFGREAKAAAAVVHQHVVGIHNVETEGETPFLVMSYVAGESLQTRVERVGPLSSKEILRIGVQVASGLQAAHDQGVVHRDIKPGNILLSQGIERALLTDFGLAQTVDDASLTQTGIVTGTPHYMSPEQSNGKSTDQRSDLFSLGSVLYFMATGHPPFRADKAMGVLHRICQDPHSPVWKSHPDISDSLSNLIDRLLEKKPAHRLASAGEVQKHLQQALAQLQHPKSRSFVAAKRFIRKHQRTLKVVCGGLIAISLAALAFPFFQATNAVEKPAPSVNQLQAPTSEDQPQQFSLETWQQAAPAEAQRWATDVQILDRSLRRLEHTNPGESKNRAFQSQWNQQLFKVHQQLDQFRNQ